MNNSNIEISEDQLRSNFMYLKSKGVENPLDLLHPHLSSMKDTIDYTKKNSRVKVHGHYLRSPFGYVDGKENVDRLKREGLVKPGKGYFKNGELKRKYTSTETTDALHTHSFIPCKDEESAYILEKLFHNTLESLGHKRISTKNNQNGKKHDKEFFNGFNSTVINMNGLTFSDDSYHSDTISYFHYIVSKICNSKQVGRHIYKPEYYQKEAAEQFLKFYKKIKSKDYKGASKDRWKFYLMMKPRSGKNLTVFDILTEINWYENTMNNTDSIIVDYISYWPSAFQGAKDDIDLFKFIQPDDSYITIDYVDTNESGWRSRFDELNGSCNIIVRFASMQSLSRPISSNYNSDKEMEGDIISFDESKLNFLFEEYPSDVYIKDESDYGLRTDLSVEIEKLFSDEKIIIELSGSDFYAIKNLINYHNHYLYDIIQEEKDIRAGKLNRKRPLLQIRTVLPLLIPNYDEISIDVMDSHSLSRRNQVLFNVIIPKFINEDYRKKAKTSILSDYVKFDKVDEKFKWIQLDGTFGEEVKFTYTKEVFDYINRTYEWRWNDITIPKISPRNCDNIFWTLPSKLAVFATYNHATNGDILSDALHDEFICLNHPDYSDPFKVEKKVNKKISEIGGSGSIVFTVGRMLRGAKAPWDCVVRMDDKTDAKLNIQTNLRCQNTNKDECYVFDPNIWRASQFKDSVIRKSSDGTNESELWQEIEEMNLLQVYATGEFKDELLDINGISEFALTEQLSKSFDNINFFNDNNENIEFLSSIEVTSISPSSSSSRDKKSGKTRNSPNKNNPPKLPDDGKKIIKNIQKKFRVIASQIPVLLLLDNSNSYDLRVIIEKFPNELFTKWISRLGIDILNTSISEFKKLILSLFNIEQVNKKIRLAKGRFESEGLTSEEYSKLSLIKKADVNTPPWFVKDMLSMLNEYIVDNMTFLDISCGSSGEFAFQRAQYLKSIGKCPSDYIYIMDKDSINVELVIKRLKQIDKNFNIKNNVVDYIKFITNKIKMKFDVVVGNPPFNSSSGTSTGNVVWPDITNKAFSLVRDGGYLSLIHPPKWRQPVDNLSFLYKENQILYLNMNSVEEGKRVFGASTPFDYYVLHKTIPYKKTDLIDFDDVKLNIDVSNFEFIPNNMVNFWIEQFNDNGEKFEFRMTYTHEPRNSKVQMNEDTEFRYPLTHTFRKNDITYRFSNIPHEHQNNRKIIFGDNQKPRPIYDEGKYGCTHHSIYMILSKKEDENKYINFIQSDEFYNITKSITFSQRQFYPAPLNFITKSYVLK